MPATLRELIATPRLGLAAVPGAPAPAAALDASVSWAHSSDLVDPTPWLEAGQLLLTDGTQFGTDLTTADAVAYIARLASAGVVGLGFATDVAHEVIPPSLVDAAARAGFGLFEVRARSPFIAIIRHVAGRADAERRERLEWSQDAQRAVARAALRPDGLGAVLRELESRLGCWVRLYDAAGEPVATTTRLPVPPILEPEVDEVAARALRRGAPSGGRLQLGGEGATLQTLGRRDALHGVLVVGAATPLDAAGADLVSSVVGLASVALEQGRALEEARRHVRAGVLELVLRGDLEAATRTAAPRWRRLPEPPLRVAVVPGEPGGRPLEEELAREAERSPERCFYAERDGGLVVVVAEPGTAARVAVLERHGVTAGVSSVIDWPRFEQGLREAERAARLASARVDAPPRPVVGGSRGTDARTPAGRIVRFESLAEAGLIGALDEAGAEPIARRLLAPVLEAPGTDQRALLPTADVWLRHNGAWDPAARELGVHRHTLRARIRTLETLLGLRLLDSFADRAELWAAMRLVGIAPP